MNKGWAPKKAHKRHNADLKRRVLEHWKASGQTAAQVTSEFGGSTFTRYVWRKAHQGPRGGPDTAALAARVAELEQELAVVREQRDILKNPWAHSAPPRAKSMPTSKR